MPCRDHKRLAIASFLRSCRTYFSTPSVPLFRGKICPAARGGPRQGLHVTPSSNSSPRGRDLTYYPPDTPCHYYTCSYISLPSGEANYTSVTKYMRKAFH